MGKSFPLLSSLLFILLSFISFCVCPQSFGTVTATGTTFPQEISFVKWLSPDYNWLYLSSAYLWRSYNSGKDFTKVDLPNQPNPRVADPKGPINIVKSIVETASRDQHYALGTTNMLWRTKDSGQTWSQIFSDKYVYHVIPHPSEANWAMFIVQDRNCSFHLCKEQLFVSKNMGDTNTLLSKSVLSGDKPQATWGKAGKGKIKKENIHFVGVADDKQEGTFTYFHSDDLLKSVKYRRDNCMGLLYKSEGKGYLFIAIQQSSFQSGQLLVSQDDGEKFNEVRFPKDQDQYRYNILDLSENAVFINIDFGKFHWGHLYVSDSSLTSVFTESLKFNTRGDLKVDFFKIAGLDGFYLANAYDVGQDEEPTAQDPIKTYHSSDNGGSWRTLKPPSKEECVSLSSAGCTLNLYGGTSTEFSNYYSSQFALGLVMATGKVGPSLTESGTDNVKTYLSRDAGFTWTSVKDSTYHYSFVDQGSLIVLADNQRATKQVHYSLDQGLNWIDINLDGHNYEFDAVSTPPTGINKKVAVYGTEKDTHAGRFFILDFSTTSIPTCTDADYENWNPHYDTDSGQDKCILGQKVSYKRRKRESLCFHDSTFTMQLVTTGCPCVAEDYECDFCFTRIGNQCFRTYEGICAIYDHTWVPTDCHGTYAVTQGYRLVANTKCIPDKPGAVANYAAVQTTCPASSDNGRAKTIGISVSLTITLLVCVGIFFYLFKTKPAFREWYHSKIDSLWHRYLSFRDTFFEGRHGRRADERSGTYSALASPGRSSGLDVNDGDDLIDDN